MKTFLETLKKFHPDLNFKNLKVTKNEIHFGKW